MGSSEENTTQKQCLAMLVTLRTVSAAVDLSRVKTICTTLIHDSCGFGYSVLIILFVQASLLLFTVLSELS